MSMQAKMPQMLLLLRTIQKWDLIGFTITHSAGLFSLKSTLRLKSNSHEEITARNIIDHDK